MFDVPLVALSALALVPGVRAWLLGRKLGRDPSDPALPERYLAYITTVWSWFGGVGVILVLLGPTTGMALWALMLLVTAAGGFPARRRVLEESWSLPRYLDHALRFNVAPLSFWLLALAMPAVTEGAERRWPVAFGVGAALFLFLERFFTWFTVTCKRAVPLRDETLLTSMREIAARSRVPMPTVLVAPVVGGRWANAVALPSPAGSHVIFGSTLIEAMPTDELGAIFGHEVAHLEHHAEPREKRNEALKFWGITLASLGVSLVAAKGGGWLGPGAVVAWLVACTLLFNKVMAAHQKHEAESDRRAGELVGDPEPLVRALVRLHFLSRFPPRVALDVEATASHPSLRRRIQALRALAGAPAPAAPPPLVLRSPAPGRWAIVGHEDVVLLDGVPAEGTELAAPEPAALRAIAREVRTFPYDALADVRVTAEGAETPTLLLLTKAREQLQLPVAPADVAALQARLDVAPHTPDLAALPKTRGMWFGPEWVALVAFFLSVMNGHTDVLAGVVLALFARGSNGPMAMAVALTAHVAFGLAHMLIWRPDALMIFAIFNGLLVPAAAGFWWVSRRRARGELPVSETSFKWQVAAACGCVVWSAIQLGVDPGLAGLRANAYNLPAAGVPLAVLAAVLWKHRRARLLPALCLALACSPVLIATPWAARTLRLDAFVESRPRLEPRRDARPRELGRRDLDGSFTGLTLSPHGTTFAAFDEQSNIEDHCKRPHVVGALEGAVRVVEACAVAPLDDGGVVAVVDVNPRRSDEEPRRLELQRLSPASDATVWTKAIDLVAVELLELDEGGGLRITGWLPKGGDRSDVRGQLADPKSLVEVRRVPVELPHGPEWFSEKRDDTGATLRLRQRTPWRPKFLDRFRHGRILTEIEWGGAMPSTRLGSSALRIQCPAPPWHSRGFVCMASERDQTFLWRVEGGRLVFTGLLPGTHHERAYDLGPRVAITGWSSIQLLDRAGGAPAYFHVEDRVRSVAAADGRLGVLTSDDSTSATVTLFELPAQGKP